MPILKSRYDHTKVYRPTGTKYAEGTSTRSNSNVPLPFVRAIDEALEEFSKEFGDFPAPERSVVEVTFSVSTVTATVLELPAGIEPWKVGSLELPTRTLPQENA
jgi:hypothetical protein